MADEIRNPMDVPAGQRTPMEYLQQLFGKPMGGPPESTWEENPTATFISGGLAGVGPGGGAPKPDISSLTGSENLAEPNARSGYPWVAPSTPSPTPAGPTPGGLLPQAVPNPDQENMAMLRKLGASGLLPADFWAKHPDLAGGVMKVEQGTPEQIAARKAQGLPDISGKLYSFLEPNRKTQIEQTMSGVINQIGDLITKSLTGPNPTGVIPELGATLAALTNTAQTGSKIPSEIENQQSLTGLHRAQAGLVPSQKAEHEARAKSLLNPPERETDNAMIQVYGHGITTAMEELGKASTMGDKEGVKYWTEKLMEFGKGIDTINQRKSERKSQQTAIPQSQFINQAKAAGLSEEQIKNELAAGLKQRRITNG